MRPLKLSLIRMKKAKFTIIVLTILNALIALLMYRLPLGIIISLIFVFIGFGLPKLYIFFGKKYQDNKILVVSILIVQSVFLLFMLMNLIALISISY